jgi:phage terminase large subunit-like protein
MSLQSKAEGGKSMAKILKNYRLSQDTIGKIEELQKESNKTATDLIEAAVNYVHEELTRANKGKSFDELMLSQVLGKRIDKAS